MSAWANFKTGFRRCARWVMPVFFIVIFVAIVWIWFFYDAQRQDKLIRTAACLIAAYVGFLIWVVFGSQWKSRARWTVFAFTIVAIMVGRLGFRISGVTGDLIPIVEWRWKQRTPAPVRTSASAAAATNVHGSYSQFLGPNRNGTLAGPELLRDWKASPPRDLWRRPMGAAWSGFAVDGRFAVTQEQKSENEIVACYDLLTGQPIWSHSDKSRYATTIAGEGPRATPTIFGNRVYAMGGAGELTCLDLESGKVLWHTNTLTANGAKLPEWGVACSPLVNERWVFVTAGGRNSSMIAFDKDTGAVLWASGNDNVHWSSPIRAILNDIPQILIFSENVSSYDETTGKLLWQYPWRSPYPHVTVPLLLSDNRVLVSQGYGGGSELLHVSRDGAHWKAERIWRSIRMKSKFGTLIHREGFIYGLDDGALACIDASTGELKWKGERYGHGQMILVRDILLMMAESGDVILLEPNPEEPRELARFKVFNAKTWNPPALAGDLLLVRNDQEAACLQLPLKR